MLEYLAYGAIGIAMATTILTFRLLTSEQKKDTPNESILKMIKWFMGLTVFFSIFFGVIELIKGDGEEHVTTLGASIDLLKSKQLETFTIQENQLNKEKVDVVLYYGKDGEQENSQTATLGKLSSEVQQDFQAIKSGYRKWDILLGNAKLGRIQSDWNVLKKKGTKGEWIEVGEWNRLKKSSGEPSEFWFKIDNIRWVSKTDSTGNYRYQLNFGEGESASSISVCDEECIFYETYNGRINLSNLKPLNMKSWKREYYVAFGAGQPSKSDANSRAIDRVELFNVYAIQMDLE